MKYKNISEKKLLALLGILVCCILLLLATSTLIDRNCYNNGDLPIFASASLGGECVVYEGCCYTVVKFYPMTSDDDDTDYKSMEWYWFWEY